MVSWGPDGFGSKKSYRTREARSLRRTIANLSPKAKQAFHAAATRTEIARGTWNGCAFNAASKQFDASVHSVEEASVLFEMNPADVRHFIQAWDNSSYASDAEATKHLKFLLEEVGLFEETRGKKLPAKTFVKVVHESDITKEKKIFDAMVEGLDVVPTVDLDEDMQEFKVASEKAMSLLGV